MVILFAFGVYFIATFYALNDYWNPVYLNDFLKIEYLLYGFLFGGLLTSVYESIFWLKVNKYHSENLKWYFIAGAVIAVASFLVMVNFY